MKYRDMMRESLVYMERHEKEDICIGDLARQFIYNEEYFAYLFSSWFQMTVSEYQSRTREKSENSCQMSYERQIPYSIIREQYVRKVDFLITGESIPIMEENQENIFELTTERFLDDRKARKEDNMIAVWWHDSEYRFHYTIGVETEKEEADSDTTMTIPESDYVILYTGRDSDEEDMAETQKMLLKYAFSEWEESQRYVIDQKKYYFICCHRGKIYLYLPVVEKLDEEEVQIEMSEKQKETKKKIYGVDTWIKYIDDHIKENPTPEGLAKTFHYSYQHFRHIFRMYYNMSVSDYIRKRKLSMAADEIVKGRRLTDIAEDYGFKSYPGFLRAFKKEFGTLPGKYSKAQFEIVDLSRYYAQYNHVLKVSYVQMDEIKIIGHTIIPGRGEEVDIPAQVAYWIDNNFPCMENTRFVCNKERREDKCAMWYHEPGRLDIEYILGPVVDDFCDVPEDMIQVTLPAGRYAIFETEKENDRENLSDTVRMFARCVLYGWIKEYRQRYDFNRYTFERYVNNKVYQYVPILD